MIQRPAFFNSGAMVSNNQERQGSLKSEKGGHCRDGSKKMEKDEWTHFLRLDFVRRISVCFKACMGPVFEGVSKRD